LRASFYEGIQATDATAKGLPSTDEIIAQFAKSGQVVKVVGEGFTRS
jgi:hypothetical protein